MRYIPFFIFGTVAVTATATSICSRPDPTYPAQVESIYRDTSSDSGVYQEGNRVWCAVNGRRICECAPGEDLLITPKGQP